MITTDDKMAKASQIYLNHYDALRRTESEILTAQKEYPSKVLDVLYDEVMSDIIDGIGVLSQLSGIPGEVLRHRHIDGWSDEQIAAEMYYSKRTIRSFARTGRVKLYNYLPDKYREEVA